MARTKKRVEAGPPQIRIKTELEAIERHRETARKFGYSSLAPFIRRLLDAADKANPDTGVINFFRGSDDAGARAA